LVYNSKTLVYFNNLYNITWNILLCSHDVYCIDIWNLNVNLHYDSYKSRPSIEGYSGVKFWTTKLPWFFASISYHWKIQEWFIWELVFFSTSWAYPFFNIYDDRYHMMIILVFKWIMRYAHVPQGNSYIVT